MIFSLSSLLSIRVLLQGSADNCVNSSEFIPPCIWNALLHNPRLLLDIQGARGCTRTEKCLRIKDPEIWRHLSEILLAPCEHFFSAHKPIWTDLKSLQLYMVRITNLQYLGLSPQQALSSSCTTASPLLRTKLQC